MFNGDVVSQISAYEEGELSHCDAIELFVTLFNLSMLGHLQGSYQRTFADYISQGVIVVQDGKAIVADEDCANNDDVVTNAKEGEDVVYVEYDGEGKPVTEGKPVLQDVERSVVFQVGSYAIDEFLSKVFDINFEFEAEEELGDGDIRTFDVEDIEMEEDELADIKSGFGGISNTGDLLNHACFLKLIEPGEYVIRNRA